MPDSRPKVFVWVYEGIPSVYCTEGVDVLVVDTDPDDSFDCVHGTFDCVVETVSPEELRKQVNILYTEWIEDKNEYGIPDGADLEQMEKLEHSLLTFGTELWAKSRDGGASSEASDEEACTEEAPVIVTDPSDPDDGDEE